MYAANRLHLIERTTTVDTRFLMPGGATPDVRLEDYANLSDAISGIAQRRWMHPALVTETATYNYGWLEEAARTVASRLGRTRNFCSGARVALLCDNSPAYLAGFYGILRARGVVVPLPGSIERDRIATILRSCGIRHVLTAGQLRPQLTGFLGEQSEEVVLSQTSQEAPASRRSANRGDLAAIFPTSGSSGDPKLVMLSHGNLLSNAASIIDYLGITFTDRALAILPFHHAFGNSVMQTHLLCGATLVRAGSTLFPNSLLDAIETHRITSFSGVPEIYRMLLVCSDLGSRQLASLRTMAVAGGALTPPEAREVARRIAPARLFVMYGQTEATARISYLDPRELERRPGSIGRGVPGVELQVVDPAGRPVEPGVVGELQARGPNVMLGYWGSPGATAQVLRQGWLHTGDLATVDHDGYVYLRGRANDLVKVAGYRVHPAEIEGLVARRLPVRNVAVVACETPLRDTRLAMFVEPAPASGQLTAGDVLAICREELPHYKVPAIIEILARLPLTSSMKVDRPALKRLAAERMAA
jgi:acyl-CoA synthetase (AMP-forming)/AMP-acid ligase II